MQDVIVVGGGYAGMAAALQLLRARRRVTVIDAGQRRNRFARHAQGFLSRDGEDPAAIAAEARAQLARYPTLDWRDGRAEGLQGIKGDFTVTLEDGTPISAARVILALGVSDRLPEIDGLAERWGRSVFHCPYCHGYELGFGRIGVIAPGAEMVAHAPLYTEWGAVTLLTHGLFTPQDAERAMLAARGIALEETPIAAIEGEAEVRLSDGRLLEPFAGLFTVSRTSPATPIADLPGLEMMETPMGVQIRTDSLKETSIPGLYACGDVAHAPHSLSLAVADGSWAGVMAHRSLVFG